jgi:hypothetical protein
MKIIPCVADRFVIRRHGPSRTVCPDSPPGTPRTAVRQYIEELRGEEALTNEALAAIREGLEDIQHGRVMDVQEYRRTRGM